MSQVSQHSVKEIFAEALEKPEAERSPFLDEVCGRDTKLRADVEQLLAAHDGAEGFLSSPTSNVPTITVERISEGPGSTIGRYKLLQEIGEGGFGTVYMAEQKEPVKRKVALKIIKLGMDTRQVIGRFEAERQALAMMDHPNIAKVLDAGATETGRPYFVMELVKGVPITEYCDRNNLSTEARLGLFTQVCSAIQHAHQKGIIHRDLKPSNVMVTLHDGTPVPKVIDFGIAKATNQELTQKTVFTEFRQFLGTPEYMSPEQAEMSGLDIDTRSDIYSLGVLLYELLTGTTPFDPETLRSKAYGEIQRIIREQEPAKPSTRVSTLGEHLSVVAKQRHTDPAALRKLMRGDLDWIVMKALEKDRTRRYETANGLAMDIKRYLSDDPVLASPPTAAYRFRKFVRRNRAAVVGAALVSVLLIFGLTAIAIGLVVVKHERDRAVEAEAIAQAERDRAQLAEEKAKLLRRLFGGGTVALAVLPLENLSDDPQQAYFADGMTEALIDDLKKIGALRLISGESVMRYKGTTKSLPEIAQELNVDAVLEGSVLRAANRLQVSARLVHAATDQQLWADNYQGDVGKIFEIQSRMSQDIAGEIQLQLTPQEQNRLASAPSIPAGAHEAYLRGRHFLGQWNEDAMYKALEEFDRAIELHPDYALAYAGRADAYLRLETLRLPPKETMPLARAAAEKALELDDTLAEAHVMLGYVLLQFDWDWNGAEQSFKRALELNPNLAQAHVGYAWYLAAVMQPEKALETLARAEILDPVTLVNNTTDHGLVAYMARDYELTVEIAERAIELNPYYWRVHAWKAVALSQLGRHSEALEAINESLRLEENPLNVAFYGGICAKAGMDTEAREALGWLRRMSETRYVCPYEVATVYVALGEYDVAFEWLNKAVEDKSGCIPWLLADTRLDPLHDDPRFADLLRRTNHAIPEKRSPQAGAPKEKPHG